jgi:hypothetical protein
MWEFPISTEKKIKISGIWSLILLFYLIDYFKEYNMLWHICIQLNGYYNQLTYLSSHMMTFLFMCVWQEYLQSALSAKIPSPLK